MVGALVSDTKKGTKYSASYGTGDFDAFLVNTTMEFGPFKLSDVTMAAAVTVEEDLVAHGKAFR